MSTFIKNKRWYVDFRFEHQRIRKPSPENSKRGAEAYEASLRSRQARGESILETKGVKQIAFGKFVIDWMRDYVKTNNKPSEQVSKQFILDKHLIPFFGKKLLNDIRSLDIECYKKAKEYGGLSHKTINNHLTVLRKALVTAVEWGRLENIPTIKWLKVMKNEPRSLSQGEAERLIAAVAHDPWQEMVFLALSTGMRLGEVLAVSWEDIDWLQETLTVSRSISRGEVGTPKNNKLRHIPLTDEVLAILGKRQNKLRAKRGFIFSENGKPFTSNRAQYVIEYAAKKAGLEKVHWHALRHTFASLLVQNGAPMRSVQSLLGHSSIVMTERYSHMSQPALKSAMTLIDFGTLSGNFGHPVVTGQKTESPNQKPLTFQIVPT